MDVIESKLYNFTFNVEGQGFGFGIPASSQLEAMQILQRRIDVIKEELASAINNKKSGSAN